VAAVPRVPGAEDRRLGSELTGSSGVRRVTICRYDDQN
jgi:hypothetical protein